MSLVPLVSSISSISSGSRQQPISIHQRHQQHVNGGHIPHNGGRPAALSPVAPPLQINLATAIPVALSQMQINQLLESQAVLFAIAGCYILLGVEAKIIGISIEKLVSTLQQYTSTEPLPPLGAPSQLQYTALDPSQEVTFTVVTSYLRCYSLLELQARAIGIPVERLVFRLQQWRPYLHYLSQLQAGAFPVPLEVPLPPQAAASDPLLATNLLPRDEDNAKLDIKGLSYEKVVEWLKKVQKSRDSTKGFKILDIITAVEPLARDVFENKFVEINEYREIGLQNLNTVQAILERWKQNPNFCKDPIIVENLSRDEFIELVTVSLFQASIQETVLNYSLNYKNSNDHYLFNLEEQDKQGNKLYEKLSGIKYFLTVCLNQLEQHHTHVSVKNTFINIEGPPPPCQDRRSYSAPPRMISNRGKAIDIKP
jgi:hypothetical protein